MTHKTEIKRWANCPDGTKVYFKSSNENRWSVSSTPLWKEENIYIVDDEWAELRRAIIDGKTVEFNHSVDGWVSTENIGFKVENYRIKPDVAEVIYYYQYETLTKNKVIIISYYVTEEYAKHLNYIEANGWYKIESSKRTWEH